MERRGQAIRVLIMLVNWQQEEPNGCDGERQLFLNGTSRVHREIYAPFCERFRGEIPRAYSAALSDGRPYRDNWTDYEG